MATRKPDWAVRAVRKQAGYSKQLDMVGPVSWQDAAALLRAHHRMVKKRVREAIAEHEKVLALIGNDQWKDRLPIEGGLKACLGILSALKEMTK
jgi:hypothetical protein